MSKAKTGVSYKELIRFFLPLAITPFIIGVVHNVANGAIARLPAPELSLAVFTVIKGFSNIVRAPIFMGKQAIISLVNDEASCKLVLKMLWIVGGIAILILFLMGYTPLGGIVLRNIIGLKEGQQITYGYYALRIVFLLPLVELVRNNNQGLVIALKKTKFILPGILVRLIFVLTFMSWVVSSQSMPGIVAGSLAWVGGIGLEGLFIFIVIRYIYNSPGNAAEKISHQPQKENLTPLTFFKFLSPLALMMVLARVVEPIIQSGIARGDSPTRSLAAFGVAWTILFLVAGPLMHLNQGSLVYVKKVGDKNWKKFFRFSYVFSILTAFVIGLFAITPIGYWVINAVLAVSRPVTILAQKTLMVLIFYPLIAVIREVYWGILMNQKKTNQIGIAKTINIIVVSISLIVGIFTLQIDAAIIGAAAFLLGEGFEAWYVRSSCLNNKDLNNKDFPSDNFNSTNLL
ncbi:MAG: hypothetical protein ACOC4G_14810 [Bacillota bacterium]